MAEVDSALAGLVEAMDGAMVVVTASDGEGRADGCLVGFHSQCSIQPPLYAVWLSVANRTRELAGRATHLAVHLLGADDGALAERFGGLTGDEVDKFAGLPWTRGPGAVPLLDDLPARLVGTVESVSSPGGDHDLFVIAVESATMIATNPLRLSDVTEITPGHPAEDRRD